MPKQAETHHSFLNRRAFHQAVVSLCKELYHRELWYVKGEVMDAIESGVTEKINLLVSAHCPRYVRVPTIKSCETCPAGFKAVCSKMRIPRKPTGQRKR